MYFKDGSPYVYSSELESSRLRNFGWLQNEHAFPRAEPSEKLSRVLREATLDPVNVFRGIHACELCDNRIIEVSVGDTSTPIGFGEIWIPSDDLIYVAPSLVYHYVTVHQYAPPRRVVEAIERLPDNRATWDTPDGHYKRLLASLDDEVATELVQEDLEGRTHAKLLVYEDPHIAAFGVLPESGFVLLERLRTASAGAVFLTSELPDLIRELERLASIVGEGEGAILLADMLRFVIESNAKGFSVKAEPNF